MAPEGINYLLNFLIVSIFVTYVSNVTVVILIFNLKEHLSEVFNHICQSHIDTSVLYNISNHTKYLLFSELN